MEAGQSVDCIYIDLSKVFHKAILIEAVVETEINGKSWPLIACLGAVFSYK